jgi:acetylornithine deacetylase
VPDVARLLADLVAIPSINPMGRPLVGPDVLESRLTDYLEQFCQTAALPSRRQAVAPGRDNLLIRYDAPGSRRTLLFDAHQDTVPVDGMTIAPFEPDVAGGRLYGRGACDIKGGLAAMLTALARLAAERPAGSASVILACTVDEEFTHTGSSRLAAEPLGAELAIVAEPTRLNLVTTHKGAVRWKVRTRGVACHSSTPEQGQNAIYTMARVIDALAAHAAQLADAPPDEILGPPSLSVGRIEGGQSVNVVPDWCEIEIDRRVIPGEDPQSCAAQAADFVSHRLSSRDSVDWLPPWVSIPPLVARVSAESLDAISAVVRQRTGRTPTLGGVPFGTDAGPLGLAGIPCVVLGPGDIAQAHTKDEWVELDQVRLAAEIYFDLARALG